MPKVVRAQQPTIAIITAQYCEKLAVDAMIDNRDTYVRYKTEGKLINQFERSSVCTLNNFVMRQANPMSTHWAILDIIEL